MSAQISLDGIGAQRENYGCGGCICKDCLWYNSGRCPHGGCYDNWRNIHNPYDKAHPGKPPRTQWTNWKTDQGYWCRGGTFYSTGSCENFMPYTGSVVKTCLFANVQIFQDGYISCSLVESVGCAECYQRFEERLDEI